MLSAGLICPSVAGRWCVGCTILPRRPWVALPSRCLRLCRFWTLLCPPELPCRSYRLVAHGIGASCGVYPGPPCAPFHSLRFAAFCTQEGCTDGQVHLDIARELHTPSLKGWCLTTFYVFVVIAILEQAQFCVAQNDLSYYVFPSSSIFYINGVSSDLVQTLREFFLSILILVLLLQKLKSDCRNWPFFPMPLLCSGRVEYVLGWTAYVIFQVLVEAPIISPTKVDRVLSTRWTTNSTEFIQSISPRTVQFHLEYVISILYLTLICMIGLLESVVALINCVTASLRYRDFRYLLSATMRRAEGDRLIA